MNIELNITVIPAISAILWIAASAAVMLLIVQQIHLAYIHAQQRKWGGVAGHSLLALLAWSGHFFYVYHAFEHLKIVGRIG